jgi:hypothetical protein
MNNNLYNERFENTLNETIKDRINTKSNLDIEYPSRLIISIESVNTSFSSIMTLIRNNIYQSKSTGTQSDIILNFAIDYFDYINYINSDLYIQKFVSLAEYINDILQADETIKISINIRGIFLKGMLSLLFLNVPIIISKHTFIEDYDQKSFTYYHNVINEFSKTLNVNINLLSSLDVKQYINQFIKK